MLQQYQLVGNNHSESVSQCICIDVPQCLIAYKHFQLNSHIEDTECLFCVKVSYSCNKSGLIGCSMAIKAHTSGAGRIMCRCVSVYVCLSDSLCMSISVCVC